MDFKKKYLKYKLKYINKKKLLGGNLNNFKELCEYMMKKADKKKADEQEKCNTTVDCWRCVTKRRHPYSTDTYHEDDGNEYYDLYEKAFDASGNKKDGSYTKNELVNKEYKDKEFIITSETGGSSLAPGAQIMKSEIYVGKIIVL